jgi:hypothetical protein
MVREREKKAQGVDKVVSRGKLLGKQTTVLNAACLQKLLAGGPGQRKDAVA